MQLIRSFSVFIMCWAGLAVAANDIPMTAKQSQALGIETVAVYVPQSYHWAGQLFILPRGKVKKIDKITAGEAMKYAVTGGVVDLDAERKDVSAAAEEQPFALKN